MHKGEHVIKYGFPIGEAKTDIPQGSHVHVHNLRTLLSGELEYQYHPRGKPLADRPAATFAGYPRRDGHAGVRNEMWILPTVGCVNDVARALERRAQALVGGGVEGVCAFPHPYGCSQMGEDQENTRRLLADPATHPNAGGLLLLGLGCENSGVDQIRPYMDEYDPDRVRFLVCQQVEDEVAEAMRLLEELATHMRRETRVPCLSSKLVVGLKCGGSDGFSGITANPVIGGFSDLLIAQGGSTILTEVPEMFGAETILMDRCENKEMFRKTVDLINGFKRYFEEHHQTIYENPSPGNKAGGDQHSGGQSPGLYAEKRFCARQGRAGLWTESQNRRSQPPFRARQRSGGLHGAGRRGRADRAVFDGTRPSPVPTVKIASNSHLASHKHGWIDFNAGELLDGKGLGELSKDLMDYVLAVAGGRKVCGERNGYHDTAIFKTGVTL